MHRILILGGQGLLGQMVERILGRSADVTVKKTCRSHEQNPFHFNVEDGLVKLDQIVQEQGPFDYIINCIGILKSRIDEQDPVTVRRAILVNALFPHELSILAQKNGSKVIHISTDGVFSNNAAVCMEDSPLDCDDIYGKTKSLGELMAPDFLNLRCSIIGPSPLKKQGLLEWLRNQPPGSEVQGYTDQIWNGVTTLQFAQLCRLLILKEAFDAVRNEAPVLHFCPNQPVTKYELLQMLKVAFKLAVTVKPGKSRGAPVNRILNTHYQILKDLFGHDLSMQHAIDELANEI